MAKEVVRIGDKSFDINYIEKDSTFYPYKLRQIENPPEKLYFIGEPGLLNRQGVAVVGSRKYTVYGKQVARMIGRRLSEAGLSVISGLAKGIDAFAHEGALEVPSLPIAVLGSGIRRMYPPGNLNLMRQVAERGIVISEYPPDFEARVWSFPLRNRIISGLSDAVVLVEANANSGSLITAQCATDQGREIFAVPGNINSQFSMGTNQLIRDGANPLIVIDDILVHLGVPIPGVDSPSSALKASEQEVVEAVRKHGGARVDIIAGEVGKDASKVNAILTILEIKGIVVSNAGKFYLAK